MDPDQEPFDRVDTVCIYFSYICSRRHKQMTFSGVHLSSAHVLRVRFKVSFIIFYSLKTGEPPPPPLGGLYSLDP